MTLFYVDQLPPAARIRVVIDGGALRLEGVDGPPDLDADGNPGGLDTIDFDTLRLAVIPGTSVCGRVFASRLAEMPGGETVNMPLEGVVITVDGMGEELRAVTDAMGNFRLEPVPAGRFFVHIDGREAVNAGRPEGAYYPFVGKAWRSIAGQEVSVGDVFLPLIAPGTLNPVSRDVKTDITFPPAVTEERPELAGVQITVPPDSLFAGDGTRGGRVGIAPVPPDRLPSPLPPGLEFPLVITVQTDGGTNFDQPVPARFPNLPDPETGEVLAPGEKSALWSFNHDTGRFEVAGPMTVSPDGEFLVTDPGVGIRAPGWHGSNGGSSGSGGGGKDGDCGKEGVLFGSAMTQCSIAVAAAATQADTFGAGWVVGAAEVIPVGFDCKVDPDGCLGSVVNTAVGFGLSCIPIVGGETSAAWVCGVSGGTAGKSLSDCVSAGDGQGGGIADDTLFASGRDVLADQQRILLEAARIVEILYGDAKWSTIDVGQIDLVAPFLDGLRRAMTADSDGGTRIVDSERTPLLALELPDEITHDDASRLLERWDRIMAGTITADEIDWEELRAAYVQYIDSTLELMEAGWETVFDGYTRGVPELFELTDERNAATSGQLVEGTYYRLTHGGSGFVQRGRLDGERRFAQLVLQPDSLYSIEYVHPETLDVAYVVFRSAPVGEAGSIPAALFGTPQSGDGDGDGLSDEAEEIVGSNPGSRDTDGDGILDGAEIRQGSDPLGGLLLRAGVVGAIDTPGEALHIAISDDIAVVADSVRGESPC